MGFTLSSVATTGLPAGQYVVRVEDVEAGVSATSKNDKITFTAIVAHSDNLEVKVGTKEIWSYTYAKQHISILANDLVRAGLPKDLMIEGNATLDAKLYAQHMRGQHYVVNVVQQKKDPTRTNTSFVAGYNPTGLPQAAQMPAPVAQAPAPVAQQPSYAGGLAPGMFPAPTQTASANAPAWGNPPPQTAQQNPFSAQPAPTFAPNPMPQFGQPSAPAPQQQPVPTQQFQQQLNQAPQGFQSMAPSATAYQPPQQQQAAPAPVPPQQLEEAPLNPDLIQALQRGERPPLNGRQLAQLKQVGWTQVFDEYQARQQQAAPAFNPAAALMAQFDTV